MFRSYGAGCFIYVLFFTNIRLLRSLYFFHCLFFPFLYCQFSKCNFATKALRHKGSQSKANFSHSPFPPFSLSIFYFTAYCCCPLPPSSSFVCSNVQMFFCSIHVYSQPGELELYAVLQTTQTVQSKLFIVNLSLNNQSLVFCQVF
jgi:hypothetical protein